MISKIINIYINKGTTLNDFIHEIEKMSDDYTIDKNMVAPINVAFTFMDETELKKIEGKW